MHDLNRAEGLAGDGSDGSSVETAIAVNSVPEEYEWIRQNCAGFTLLRQRLVQVNGKPYDIHEMRSAEGEARSVFFDISRFFGRF